MCRIRWRYCKHVIDIRSLWAFCCALVTAAIFLVSTIYYPLSIVCAAPCYGTHMPNTGKWTIGAQTHIIDNRQLQKDYGKVSSRQYFYQMSYGVFSWLCLDGKIGIGDITHRYSGGNKVTYLYNFAGGYGFRLKPYRDDVRKVEVACGFQHISVHPDTKIIDGVTNYVILDDWQGSIIASKGLGPVTPYIGTRLTRLDLIHRIKGDGRKRKKSDVDFGAVAGVDFNISKSSYLNLEARFIHETSFNFGFTHNF